MGSNYGSDELRSGESSPTTSFEWGVESNSRDTFEPVPLFDSNSDGSVEIGRTQQYDNLDPSPEGARGEKRGVKTTAMEALEEMPAISRRKKKAKGIPKRPMGAYALFFSRERSKLIDNEGDPNSPSHVNKRLSFEELENIIGMRWKNLSAAEREELENLAAEDSVRYRNEMESFEKKKHKSESPPLQQQPPPPPQGSPRGNDPSIPIRTPVAPPPAAHSPAMHHHYMGYMPPPSPSASRSVPPPQHQHAMYGHPPQHTTPAPPRSPSRRPHSRQHHPQHYPPPPYPSHSAAGYPSEVPPSHYYPPPPPVVSSTARAQGQPPMRRPSIHPPPPPPPVNSAPLDRGMFPIPPGMELMLPDRDGRERKYRVQYACYTMTREDAQAYVDRLANAISHREPPPPPPQNPRLEEEVPPRRPAWGDSY